MEIAGIVELETLDRILETSSTTGPEGGLTGLAYYNWITGIFI